MTGDNVYIGRVYTADGDDERVSPLQRALHVELCRDRPHADNPGLCGRAVGVIRRWEADGRPRLADKP